jgi:hypothetical protein
VVKVMYDYVHLLQGEDIGPAGRAYHVSEVVLTYAGRQVLFLDVESTSGVSCCDGSYASHLKGLNVKGYILDWKCRENERGELVSQIGAIKSEGDQIEIARILQSRYGTSQITFE